MYNVFINVFSTTLEFHAPLIKSFQQERKIAEKHWLTKKLRDEITEKRKLLISGKRTHRSNRITFSNIREIWLIGV